MLRVKRLTEYGRLPIRATDGAAGYDLTSPIHLRIFPYTRKLVPLDIAIEFPEHTYGRIASRSGMAMNHCIDVAAGVVDRDYRGNIGVLLVNNSPTTYVIQQGERIAQLIVETYHAPKIIEVGELTNTYRGDRGFGSNIKQ